MGKRNDDLNGRSPNNQLTSDQLVGEGSFDKEQADNEELSTRQSSMDRIANEVSAINPKESPEERIERLVSEILEHNDRYYNQDNPIVSDKEYDDLYRKLVELEEEYPELVLGNSPTRVVGASANNAVVTHSIPMLSLENSYNREDVLKFFNRVERERVARSAIYDDERITYSVEPKMDGAAVSVTYINAEIAVAATRGDGLVGEDITQNVKTIKSLPKKINYYDELIVRGEVFMPKKEFERLNLERAERGLQPFANPRNAAAGSLKLLDEDEARHRALDIKIYSMEINNFINERGSGERSTNIGIKHSDDLAFCKSLGLPINELNSVCVTSDEVFEKLDEIEALRFNLPYDIDGAVIKVNEYAPREDIGSTGKFPKWAIAYKYPAMQATTILRDVSFQVGRTGVVTPVAELEPVQLSGSIISRATLHNEDEIARLGVRIGDTVFIEKGGEIIPKIVKVVMEMRQSSTTTEILFPERCPVCNSKLVKPEGEVRWRCLNPQCSARLKATINQFVSRGAMDVEGLGSALIDALVDEGRVKEPADIYTLTFDELANRERLGAKSAQNLMDSIQRSKSREFYRVLFGLGLPQIGISTARTLAGYFLSMDALVSATKEELILVEDVGEKTAKLLIDALANEELINSIGRLRRYGLNFNQAKVEEIKSSISDKTFVLTGTLSVSRKSVEEEIIALGGKVVSAVSKSVDYVIAGIKLAVS